LVVGHVTQDLVDGQFVLGGTATYSAVTAARLGLKVRVLTAAGVTAQPALEELARDAEVSVVESAETTVFKNTYSDDRRVQYLLSAGSDLTPSALPGGWKRSDIAHLGPVANEVDQSFVGAFARRTSLGITPQGWLRSWDSDGRVRPEPWMPDPEWLRRAGAIVLSQEDVGERLDLIDYYARYCPVTVVTRGYRGCTLYSGGEVHHLGTRPAREVDPTGAGDVFAAAFFIRLHETGDAVEAARFANVAGSMAVEGPGTTTIPARRQVADWLENHRL